MTFHDGDKFEVTDQAGGDFLMVRTDGRWPCRCGKTHDDEQVAHDLANHNGRLMPTKAAIHADRDRTEPPAPHGREGDQADPMDDAAQKAGGASGGAGGAVPSTDATADTFEVPWAEKAATAPGTSRSVVARATPAQVEAVMSELTCERLELDAGDDGASWCRRHHISLGRWTDRGCPMAVRLADAVVAAGSAPDGNPLHEAPATRDAATTVPTGEQRHAAYADAVLFADSWLGAVPRVMAVADAEQAELRAENSHNEWACKGNQRLLTEAIERAEAAERALAAERAKVAAGLAAVDHMPLIVSGILRDIELTPDGRGGELHHVPATPGHGKSGCPGDNLSRWPAEIRAALAGPAQDKGCGCLTDPGRALSPDGDPGGCYCDCSDLGRDDCDHAEGGA